MDEIASKETHQARKPSKKKRTFLLTLLFLLLGVASGLAVAYISSTNRTGTASEDAAEDPSTTSTTSPTTTTTTSTTTPPLTDIPQENTSSAEEVSSSRKLLLTTDSKDLLLVGSVPNKKVEQSILDNLRNLPPVFSGKVINNLEIDPDAPAVLARCNIYLADTIVFEKGTNELTGQENIRILDFVHDLLSTNEQVTATFEGYTDAKGDAAENADLAINRSHAVVKYLTDKEITSSRMSLVGAGEENPVAPNDTEEGKQMNRRVEIGFMNLLRPRARC